MSEALSALQEWFLIQGGSLRKAEITEVHDAMGFGLVATERIAAAEEVITVPLSLCLHVEAIDRSIVKDLVGELDNIRAMPDELLALLLMAEKRQKEHSYWWPYLRCLPSTFDTPLFWPEKDKQYLQGTTVYLLTKSMENQIEKDWKELHAPLVEQYPDVLSGLTKDDYVWALSIIYSRAVGIDREDQYLRCLPPILDMCNHHPQSGTSLEQLVTYNGDLDAIQYRPTSPITAGQQCYLLYGPYSNAKLLYSYGFVCPTHNPFHGVDFWVRIPPGAKDAAWKTKMLQEHPLTCHPSYDFQGTLRGNGVTLPLLATLRMIELSEEEYGAVDQIFQGVRISHRNEDAALAGLARLLERKLGSWATSIDDDMLTLRRLRQRSAELNHSDACGETRRMAALTVSLEDRVVIRDTLECVRTELKILRERAKMQSK